MPEHLSRPFRLKGLFARNVGVEPDDTVLTKRTLKRLGFYKVPDYGLTPWPDGAMFKGIETFQERNRLKVDGVMAPGEETETWLGKALKGEKRRISDIFGLGSYVGPGRANRPQDVRLTKRALALAGHYPADLARETSAEADSLLARGISAFQSRHGLKQDGLMAPGGETERELERTVLSAQEAQGKKDSSTKGTDKAPEKSGGDQIDGKEGDVQLARHGGSPPPRPKNTEGLKFAIPEGGVIRDDPIGKGRIWEDRLSKDATHRHHKGVDITAEPGQMVPVPIDGVVTRKSNVYKNKNKGLRSTHIKGVGKWTGFEVIMFYVDNVDFEEGTRVKRGDPLGPAQDVRDKHGTSMKPHVHYKVYKDGKLIDPTELLVDKE